jgi:hypothetical protein
MASFETKSPKSVWTHGGFSVVPKPHFLETDVDYQKVWLEPHFDNHGASIAKDRVEFHTQHVPPVLCGANRDGLRG